MKILRFVLALCLFTAVLTSCNKYEDGPSLSLRTRKARFANKWQVKQVLVNGIDSTAAFAAREEMLYSISSHGAITLTCKDPSQGWVDTENGTWEFKSKKEDVAVSVVSEITHKSEEATWHLLKLEDKECWYSETENGNTIVFHLIPQ